MTTANMGLTLPDVSVTPGPTWASQINSDLTLIDQHNHTVGFGSPIPTEALNINDSLNFNNYAIVGLGYLKLNPQAATLDTSSLYVDGSGDFWYRNSAGTPVQITSASGLAATPGSITGLPSGTAAVTYLSGAGRYVFTKSTNAGAVLDSGPILLRTGLVGSNAVGIRPASGTSNYVLTLPASAPSSSSLLACGGGGLGSTFFSGLDTTLSFSGTTLGVSGLGITATQLAVDAVETVKIKDAAVTYAKLQAANIVIPTIGGSGGTSSTTFVALNIAASPITVVAGRPLFLQCMSADDGSSNEAWFNASGTGKVYLRFFAAGYGGIGECVIGSDLATDVYYPPSSVSAVVSSLPVGSYTFYLQGKVDSGALLAYSNVKIIAYQI